MVMSHDIRTTRLTLDVYYIGNEHGAPAGGLPVFVGLFHELQECREYFLFMLNNTYNYCGCCQQLLC